MCPPLPSLHQGGREWFSAVKLFEEILSHRSTSYSHFKPGIINVATGPSGAPGTAVENRVLGLQYMLFLMASSYGPVCSSSVFTSGLLALSKDLQ